MVKPRVRSIKISEYEEFIRKNLTDNVYDRLMELLNNFLPCGTCFKVLPVTDFAVCQSNRNRLGRYAHCRTCAQINYQEERDLKGIDH